MADRQKNIAPKYTGKPGIPVRIVRKKGQKYIRLRLLSEGILLVTASDRVPPREIDRALEAKRSWIEKHLEQLKRDRADYDPVKTVLFHGNPLELVIRREPGRARSRVIPGDGQLEVLIGTDTSGGPSPAGRIPSGMIPESQADTQKALKAVKNWLKREAARTLRKTGFHLSRELKIPINSVFIRDQKTRWGSSSGLGNISLNFRAVMLPEKVQTYLIIHELSHQLHFNHSSDYWKTVERFCPDYKTLNRELKKYRRLMGDFR